MSEPTEESTFSRRKLAILGLPMLASLLLFGAVTFEARPVGSLASLSDCRPDYSSPSSSLSSSTSGGSLARQTGQNQTESQSPPVGLVVPLYAPAGCEWTGLINAKARFPSVKVMAVVNPANGTGSAYNSTFATWVAKLQKGGIQVIGYVDSVYGAKPSSQLMANISAYSKWYHVDGIFIDEMANKAGYEGYYSELTKYAHSVGLGYVMGDPGTATQRSYVGTVDNLMIFEDRSLPPAALIQNRTMGLPAAGFSIIGWNVSSLPPQSYFDSLSSSISWVLITDQNHKFLELPSYIVEEMAEIAASSSLSSSSSSPTTTTSKNG